MAKASIHEFVLKSKNTAKIYKHPKILPYSNLIKIKKEIDRRDEE